jgi:hypothetical protein
MNRLPPKATSDEIGRYIRTYESLLRSTGDVHVRALEEAHAYSDSALHMGAKEPLPDLAAFAYSAARLPLCMPRVRRVILGQSHERFEQAGYQVADWDVVRARGRRRPMRFDGKGDLAVFATSSSDVDDMVPILCAFQIEWNKLHTRLQASELGRVLHEAKPGAPLPVDDATLAKALAVDPADIPMLRAAFADRCDEGFVALARRPMDLVVKNLAGSYSQYQRAALRWWSGIEPRYVRATAPKRRPVYFVSSNTHSMVNLLGGYARAHRREIIEFARTKDPEGLAAPLGEAMARGDEDAVSNITYYLLRTFLREGGASIEERVEGVQRFDGESGISTIETPGKVDVACQLVELARLRPDRLDPRVRVPGIEALARSEAVILNIDFPLGMAAYHHLTRLAQGAGELRGVYVMGKAATLNGRIGDVMLADVVHDEHSGNTYFFRNAMTSAELAPFMRSGSVLDHQQALTVRGTFLQNEGSMRAFYSAGYSVMEMEAGPYLSALCELTAPTRHPEDQVINLSNDAQVEIAMLHYASDTPYSRRQSLLSKSLSWFGVESTYACAIAIVRRILAHEVARCRTGAS